MKTLYRMKLLILVLTLSLAVVFVPASTALLTSTPIQALAAAPTPAPLTANQPSPFPPSFFAMTAVKSGNFPKLLTFGTLGHPSVFQWAWIERQKGVYDFSDVDKFVDFAKAQGLVDATNTVSMAFTLGGTPQWYVSNPSSCKANSNFGVSECTSAPTDLQAWTNYVKAVLNHYNGVTMPHIRYYELWNEMNIKLFWAGSIPEMVSLAQAAYPIVHADPHSMLLTPSVAGTVGNQSPTSGSTWMAKYLDAGGARYADGGAFHGYIAEQTVATFPMPEQDATPGCSTFTTCYGSILTKANTMRQVFDQHGLAGKPMYDTEGSWGKGTVTDPDLQTAWLARWYLLQASVRSSDNLQMAAWFAWDETSFNWGSIEDTGRQPTPAGIAFNQVYNWLVGATMSQPCTGAADGTWTCGLTRPGGYSGLVVWNTQDSKPYTPNAAYVVYRDLAGNTVQIAKGTPLTIGAKPVLCETSLPAQNTQ